MQPLEHWRTGNTDVHLIAFSKGTFPDFVPNTQHLPKLLGYRPRAFDRRCGGAFEGLLLRVEE